jgi:hypothetical protein
LLDRRRIARGECVADAAIAVGIALPGAAAQNPVRTSQQCVDRALRDLSRVARRSSRRGEGEIAVDQTAVDGERARMRVSEQPEQLLDLRRADVLPSPEEIVEATTAPSSASHASTVGKTLAASQVRSTGTALRG